MTELNGSTFFIHLKDLRGVVKLIRENEADLVFNEIFVFAPSILSYVPYPLQITEVVVLTESANPVSFILKLFYVFDLIVWIMLGVLTNKLVLLKRVFGAVESIRFKENNHDYRIEQFALFPLFLQRFQR
ncbi:hypothetical protein GWI33_006465 [Rhynchophorus ferrugineus]|uniref:Uncharacterized protein n=1 Tax=Rhynchophorus ferrugineus TaxID=354439 RepID=A0A834MDR3_RHYFE|nr:hypothetical protein GWI33_006465 [Rhynchophorus ferrugineus]